MTEEASTLQDPTITAELHAELQELRAKNAALQSERDELSKRAQLRQLAAHPVYDFVDSDLVAEFIGKQVVLENGYLIGNSGRSVNDLLNEVKAAKPHLTKTDWEARKGQGAPSSSAANSTGDIPLEKLFGSKSDSKLANDLAKRDINEYRRLKEVAKQQRLI